MILHPYHKSVQIIQHSYNKIERCREINEVNKYLNPTDRHVTFIGFIHGINFPFFFSSVNVFNFINDGKNYRV